MTNYEAMNKVYAAVFREGVKPVRPQEGMVHHCISHFR